MLNQTIRIIGASVLAGAVMLGGTIAAAAAAAAAAAEESDGEREVDTPISGSALERASAVALAHTGGESVSGTEVGDEESLYEVEVTLMNGDEVDVQLDEAFRVVGTEEDGRGED